MNPKIEILTEPILGDFATDMFHEKAPDGAKEPHFPMPDGRFRPASASFQPSLKEPHRISLHASPNEPTPQPGSWVSSLLQQRKDRPS
jgi:hypothetical protein